MRMLSAQLLLAVLSVGGLQAGHHQHETAAVVPAPFVAATALRAATVAFEWLDGAGASSAVASPTPKFGGNCGLCYYQGDLGLYYCDNGTRESVIHCQSFNLVPGYTDCVTWYDGSYYGYCYYSDDLAELSATGEPIAAVAYCEQGNSTRVKPIQTFAEQLGIQHQKGQ
jgi:hypothetical protein